MKYKGHIPEKIVYVCASPSTVQTFDEEGEIAITEKIKVTPTFCIESTQKRDTAIRWSGLKNPKQIEMDNLPIKKVQITDLEERGNGGRAYKIIVDDKYYFDLREDVLLESMLTLGIQKNGILHGEYIWVKYNTSMKLVRVNSPLHKVFEQGTVLHNSAAITKKDLVIGGIYSTKKNRMMYLGDYFTHVLEQDKNPAAHGYYGDRSLPMYINKRFIKRKVELYLEIPEWWIKDVSKLTITKIKTEGSYYYFKINKTTPKFVQHNHTMNISDFDHLEHLMDQFKKEKKINDEYYAEFINLSKVEDYIAPQFAKLNISVTKK